MSQLNELHTMKDLEQVWETSEQKPVFLFKQSTTCPISAAAFSQYNSFLDSTEEDIGTYFVKVRETREISDQIADETNIQHQSPQVFLIKNNEVVWNASHNKITTESLGAALEEAK